MNGFALLTPVPAEHLVDGEDVCRRQDKVAFGTEAWEVFAALSDIAGPEPQVLIYASHDDEHHGPVVTWVARYVGYTPARAGLHPDRFRYRPPSCRADGAFSGFYEVTELRRLDSGLEIPVESLKKRDGGSLTAGFVPRGPTIVRA
ncbi:MAG: hypothetical protein R8F63_00735 [Acidimicrobiales bacterium]|nr:hypothetical protein [Acidimicrobiales bacterium]